MLTALIKRRIDEGRVTILTSQYSMTNALPAYTRSRTLKRFPSASVRRGGSTCLRDDVRIGWLEVIGRPSFGSGHHDGRAATN